MNVHLGQAVSMERRFTQEDFDRFAALSGDDNPIHVDPVFATQTRFGRTVCHGMLLYGVICGLLSTSFPDTIQLEQELMFPAPTFAGDETVLRAEVVEVDTAQRRARLDTTVTKIDGEVVCRGRTVLQWRPA